MSDCVDGKHPRTAGVAAIPAARSEGSRRYYVLTLALLVGLTALSQLVLMRALQMQKHKTVALKATARAQLLCQRISKAALAAQTAGSRPQRQNSLAELREVSSQWTDAHADVAQLLFSNEQFSTGEYGSYMAAERTIAEQAELMIRLLEQPVLDAGAQQQLSAAASAILDREPGLLERLEAAASPESLDRAQNEWLNLTASVIVGLTLLLLLLQSALGVRQMLFLDRKNAVQELQLARERERAQQEIARISRQNELILNAAGEGIWGVDYQGRTIFVNPAAASLTGWSVDELIGQSQHDVLRHSRADGTAYTADECPICRTFRDGAVHHAADEIFWHRNGEQIPVEYRSTPIREGDAIVGAVVTFRGVAEQRRLQAQLIHAQKLESIGQLAAGIAHEINTPTQYVGDNTRFLQDAFASLLSIKDVYHDLLVAAQNKQISNELIERATETAQTADLDYLVDEVPKAITQSLEGIGRVAAIVRAMKEFSHPDTGNRTPTDLNRAISSTATVARNEWKYVAELALELDPNLPLVSCLPGDFNQVILNLIVNAAHAIGDKVGDGSAGKGTITVSTRADGDWVEIRVADTGCGIPKSARAKIFDPFFTTKAVGKGTGQGLAIAYSVIVEKHGGSISFETELGQGTCFIIRLPLDEAGAAPVGVDHEVETAVC